MKYNSDKVADAHQLIKSALRYIKEDVNFGTALKFIHDAKVALDQAREEEE